jgi:hypothetical protein
MNKEKYDVLISIFVLISNFAIFFSAHYGILANDIAYAIFVIQTFLYSFKEFSRAWLIYITTNDKETWEKAQQILGKNLTEKALKNMKK